MRSGPMLLPFTGPPGTGKSTLADIAARQLDAPVLGWDWAMAALIDFDPIQSALREMPHVEHRRVGWSILWNLAVAQLGNGRSVVLDGVARQAEVEGTREVASGAGARSLIVGTRCSDIRMHQRRIEGRARGIPGWHELDWDHVAGFLARWEPPGDVDVQLDAITPLEENVEQLIALLSQP